VKPRVIVIDATEARWWAAEIVASLVSEAGLNVARREMCPDCKFFIHIRHDDEPFLIYECLRCGATWIYQEMWISPEWDSER
jgi:DNA-directed RNA polymerase subunit M/transcription elongation factor TFIIS